MEADLAAPGQYKYAGAHLARAVIKQLITDKFITGPECDPSRWRHRADDIARVIVHEHVWSGGRIIAAVYFGGPDLSPADLSREKHWSTSLCDSLCMRAWHGRQKPHRATGHWRHADHRRPAVESGMILARPNRYCKAEQSLIKCR